MTSRREGRILGDYDGLVEVLRGLVAEWRTRGADASANVPAAREAWMVAAREIADVLGPEAQGAGVPVRPTPPDLIESAARKLDELDVLGAALDLIRAVRWTDSAADYGIRGRWESVADRLLMLVESVDAAGEAAREAATDR